MMPKVVDAVSSVHLRSSSTRLISRVLVKLASSIVQARVPPHKGNLAPMFDQSTTASEDDR